VSRWLSLGAVCVAAHVMLCPNVIALSHRRPPESITLLPSVGPSMMPRVCRVLSHGWCQGLEGSPSHLQSQVRSTFSGVLHSLVRVLERCYTHTGDLALANTVMWTTALDFEHGDHGMLLDSKLLPLLGKVPFSC
jgi:hypothetical protein